MSKKEEKKRNLNHIKVHACMEMEYSTSSCSLELISRIYHPFSNIFILQKVSKQYFLLWLF